MAVDMFLKIEGIKGESSDAKHKDTIEIESFSWGLSRAAFRGGGGGGGGRASFQDFSFIAKTNLASPLLALATATGEHYKQAVLTARKSGEQPLDYLVITLEDVLISSYQSTGDSGKTSPIPTPGASDGGPVVSAAPPEKQVGEIVESFTLSYRKIEFEYRVQAADGSVKPGSRFGWDLAKNQKI